MLQARLRDGLLMARLLTSGFELNARVSAVPIGVPDPDSNNGGTTQTLTVRSGTYAAKCDSGAGVLQYFRTTLSALGIAASRSYFVRFYLNLQTIPSVNAQAISGIASITGSPPDWVQINTDGTLSLVNSATGTKGSSSPLSTGTWYRVEYKFSTDASALPNGAYELLLDGTSIATDTVTGITAAASGSLGWGWGNTIFTGGPAPDPSLVLYLDDIAINDNQGANQTSYPGAGKVVLLSPVSDNARGTNWTAGAGGTSALWDAVNNEPPVGVVLASATNTSQIKNVAKDTTGNYDANLAAYSTAVASGGGGLVSGDTVTLVHPIWSLGGAATGTAMLLVSNPAANGGTASTWGSTSTAGTYPTGWVWQNVAAQIVYAPTVTQATSPVIRVGKRQNSTNDCECDFMGLYVDYVPGASGNTYVKKNFADTAMTAAGPDNWILNKSGAGRENQ